MKPKMNSPKQRLSPVEIVLVVATVFVVGFVGYAVYRAVIDTEEVPNQTETTDSAVMTDDEVPDAPEINDASDLDHALETLENLDLDAGTDSETELEAVAEEL